MIYTAISMFVVLLASLYNLQIFNFCSLCFIYSKTIITIFLNTSHLACIRILVKLIGKVKGELGSHILSLP